MFSVVLDGNKYALWNYRGTARGRFLGFVTDKREVLSRT